MRKWRSFPFQILSASLSLLFLSLLLSGPPAESASLDRNVILRVVQKNIRLLRRCYEQTLKEYPNLGGKIVARWTVGSEGKVVDVTFTHDKIGYPPLNSCLSKVIEAMVFPRPFAGGVVTISYPFIFRPVHSLPQRRPTPMPPARPSSQSTSRPAKK